MFTPPSYKTRSETLMKGLKKITGKDPSSIKKALKGTKFTQHPELSLSKQEVKRIVEKLAGGQSTLPFSKNDENTLRLFLKQEKTAEEKAHREEVARRNIRTDLSRQAMEQLEKIGLGGLYKRNQRVVTAKRHGVASEEDEEKRNGEPLRPEDNKKPSPNKKPDILQEMDIG